MTSVSPGEQLTLSRKVQHTSQWLRSLSSSNIPLRVGKSFPDSRQCGQESLLSCCLSILFRKERLRSRDTKLSPKGFPHRQKQNSALNMGDVTDQCAWGSNTRFTENWNLKSGGEPRRDVALSYIQFVHPRWITSMQWPLAFLKTIFTNKKRATSESLTSNFKRNECVLGSEH